MSLQNKIAVVTGATSGIGRATCLLFAENGAKVIAVGRNQEKLTELEKEIRLKNGFVKIVQTDLTDENSVQNLVDETVKDLGGTDILVNSAGIIANGTIENTTLSDWDEMMNINLRSVFLLMQKFSPSLIERKGNIVNVSSVTGPRSFPNVLAYCVSKAAVDQLTVCAALELGSKGVRVNAVNPGVVVTNLHKASGMSEENYQAFLENGKNTHPIGRVGEAHEVAELILFLASDKASWITGATYAIDGGRAGTCAR